MVEYNIDPIHYHFPLFQVICLNFNLFFIDMRGDISPQFKVSPDCDALLKLL